MTESTAPNAPSTNRSYMVEKWQEKLLATRASIEEMEQVVQPLRRLADQAEARLAMLRRSEEAFMDAIAGCIAVTKLFDLIDRAEQRAWTDLEQTDAGSR